MVEVNIISLNQKKLNTCGSCNHTNNDLGFVALHCQVYYNLIMEREDDEYDGSDKVRSWNTCHFTPSKWEPRSSGETVK